MRVAPSGRVSIATGAAAMGQGLATALAQICAEELRIAPEGVKIENPAFDVTPARHVTALITERGIARAPYSESLKRLSEAAVSV